MAKLAILKTFYASEAWQTFRLITISERVERDGALICDYCHEQIAKSRDAHLHHIIELTPENVRDVNIALNPDNIMVVHAGCHNKIHGRTWGQYRPERGAYLVYGPPLSGKTTFVQEQKGRNDMVLDMDRLYAAITMLPEYDKPDILLQNVRGVYNLLLDNVRTRYGRWNVAWVIGGFANKHKREKTADDLGAEMVFCDVSKEECLRRLDVDTERRWRKDEWRGYIEKWFREYAA